MTPQPVPISKAPITLGQFLKLANVAEDGAHAKELLDSPGVEVNDEPESRRGRQLEDGDVVTIGDDASLRVAVQ